MQMIQMLWCKCIIWYNTVINTQKTLGSLWQYYRDEPAATLSNSESFKSRIRITGKTPAAGNVKDVKSQYH